MTACPACGRFGGVQTMQGRGVVTCSQCTGADCERAWREQLHEVPQSYPALSAGIAAVAPAKARRPPG